jgi:xylan 1,4-beta-xylosidase
MKRRLLLSLVCFFSLGLTIPQTQARPQDSHSPETIHVDLRAKGQPFPHFWEEMFGSGRAVLALRESYRDDLREVKSVTDFKYVRFHAIFHDEVGVYDEDASGKPTYNFSYVDQIYDGLLKDGVRPFVELSFMPKKLAAENDLHPFWYKPTVSPPKDYKLWSELIEQFAKHLIARYGIDEVSQWYFEVWNEPNLDFWAGAPKEQTYCQLYDTTARALKNVSPRLRVGGPATAQAAWADRFIQHTTENNVPIDFVSSHVYGNDSAKDVFGTDQKIPRTQMVCRAVKKVHDQIQASARPQLPLIWTEYNASYMNETDVTDSIYMGPWMADTIRQCDGLTDMMSYWTFSDVFEEQGVVKRPFYGGYGLIAEDSLPKPAFNAFKMLHHLGDVKIPESADDILVTRRKDGSFVIAVWNLSAPETTGEPKDVNLQFDSLKGNRRAQVYRLDAEHGSLTNAYVAMGSPVYPTQAQIQTLKAAAQLPAPESTTVHNGSLALHLAPKALVVIEIR